MSNEKKKRLPRISLSENSSIFLAAFGLAVIIWAFAKSAQTKEVPRILVPVTVTPRDERIEVIVEPPVVPVTLRYPREMQGYISSENFRFEVDVSEMRTGLGLDWRSKSQVLTEENWIANVPGKSRIDLVEVGNTVQVRLRWNAQLAVVEPDIANEERLPDGMQLVRPVRVTPREVWLVGSRKVLDTIPRDEVTSKLELKTEPVDLADQAHGGLETVAIRLPVGAEIIQPETKTAEVSIDIQEVQTVREIRGVPLLLTALFPDTVELKYSPKAVTVTVFGPQSLLRTLSPQSLEVAMVRPPQEVPGESKDVALEAHFAPSVPADAKAKLNIRSVDPAAVRITYVARPQTKPAQLP